MFDNVNALFNFMSIVDYCDFTYLREPDEVYVTLEGSCHDQTLFELQELSDLGLNPHAKFIMAVDEYDQGLETHSFVYFEFDGKWYWFENAWGDLRGVRGFSTYDELLDAVMFAFGQRTYFDKLYIADFNPEEHTPGEDLATLVDVCMNSAKEYIID